MQLFLNHWFLREASCLPYAFIGTNAEAQPIIFRRWHWVRDSPIEQKPLRAQRLLLTGRTALARDSVSGSGRVRARGSQRWLIPSPQLAAKQIEALGFGVTFLGPTASLWQSQAQPRTTWLPGEWEPTTAFHCLANTIITCKPDLMAPSPLRGKFGAPRRRAPVVKFWVQDLSYLNDEWSVPKSSSRGSENGHRWITRLQQRWIIFSHPPWCLNHSQARSHICSPFLCFFFVLF